ncbi:hypothetical protein THIOM_003017 [Candidatus Thiomargarita nelsonii]|uniref:Uncharacterized protein n=1 Tax=Candidatus Thiomargarita nelsonii TaxID=1003181 RepID=A0A176RZJ9_9GAMM|nr:hypothetical protein THIOM_003017 [Candidatus Thiomargarita nelsonii]
MSKRISGFNVCPCPKKYAASARAQAVLPTPVGPANNRVATGLFGSFNPALKSITTSQTRSIA